MLRSLSSSSSIAEFIHPYLGFDTMQKCEEMVSATVTVFVVPVACGKFSFCFVFHLLLSGVLSTIAQPYPMLSPPC